MSWRTWTVVVCVVAAAGGGLAIPSRVANRMIPSWWFSARAQRTCGGVSECEVGECCVRPMLATNSYCFPFKEIGESCDASAMLLDMNSEVFFEHCPCQSHLTCANLRIISICVDPNTVESHHHLAVKPKPIQINRRIP